MLKMHLDSEVFDLIKAGLKTVELRINDAKRQRLKISDEVCFLKRPDNMEQLKVEVTGLQYFKDFEAAFSAYEVKALGYDTLDAIRQTIRGIYSVEEEKALGVVGIGFEKL